LLAQRRVVEAKINAFDYPPTPDPKRSARIAEFLTQRKNEILRGVERREKQGDFRDAMVWRHEIFRLPDVIETELGL
jgi:hypothetical protein